MSRYAWVVMVFLGALNSAGAGPLERKWIAADAKWVLHLDADRFKKSQVGEYFIDRILEPKSAKAKADLQQEFGFDLDWREIQSITVYGMNYQPQRDASAVLLLRSEWPVRKALDDAISRGSPSLTVARTDSSDGPVYSVNREVYAGFPAKGLVLVSKSKSAVEQAGRVLSGQTASLASSKALTGYPEVPFAFFFFAVAEDFAQGAKLPPKAAVLRQAEGARLAIGEANDRVRFNLSIKAASAEVADQVEKVTQGLIALASLNAGQNADLQPLAQTATVKAAGNLVTAGFEVPVPQVTRKLAEKANKD